MRDSYNGARYSREVLTITPDRREELIARRNALREHREKAQRQRSARAWVAPLDVAGVLFEVVNDEPAFTWLKQHFPFSDWGYVEWEWLTGSRCLSIEYPSDVAAASWLTALGEEFGFTTARVSVVYADAHRPTLLMGFQELVKHLNVVLDYSWDNWIFDMEGDWVIEYFHHGVWTFGSFEAGESE